MRPTECGCSGNVEQFDAYGPSAQCRAQQMPIDTLAPHGAGSAHQNHSSVPLVERARTHQLLACSEVDVTTRLYVGNLPYSTTDDTLTDLFSQYGEVEGAQVVTDRETGRSRGFGFVDMATAEDAQSAIQSLSGYQLDGRTITVEEARPRERAGAGRGRGRGGFGWSR